MQTQKPITGLSSRSPKVKNRHLDNWEGTRLYAGNNAAGTGGLNGENGTIFNFAATGASAARNLPVILDRYIVVARALASVGINGFEINLVNADNVYLTNATSRRKRRWPTRCARTGSGSRWRSTTPRRPTPASRRTR